MNHDAGFVLTLTNNKNGVEKSTPFLFSQKLTKKQTLVIFYQIDSISKQ